jgi:competence protein ComEC
VHLIKLSKCLKFVENTLEAEYQNISLWYFVSFLTGIIVYFTLESEPKLQSVLFAFFASIPLLYIKKYSIFLQFLSCLILAFMLGMLVAKYRKDNLDPVSIEKPIISQISGIVESIKPTIKGMQVILSDTKIYKLSEKPRYKVKINIPVKYSQDIFLHDEIKLLAKLFIPQNAILPSGYNFGFYAYMAGIGATGYAMSMIEIVSKNDKLHQGFVFKIRKYIYSRLIKGLGKDKGNFAAAILLGETSGLDREIMQNMRQSGISHILCVSGLHLSLVAMIFFVSTRFLLNLSDYIAYNFNIKLIAALVCLVGSYSYLELSNMQIAATRAFIMTSIFIFSVILERSAYLFRSISIAALIILTFNPEYIFHPSFQLSFVAVLSLIAGYEFYLKNQWVLGSNKGIFGSIKFYIASNIYSSFLASIITAPVVIKQFFIFSTYSVPVNLIAVPIMSFFLMPLSLLLLFLMPIHCAGWVFKLLGFFIQIVIDTAQFANRLPGAVWYFGYITNASIITFMFGFFWICIWRTAIRILGIIIILVSFILMFNSPKPDLIFDPSFAVIGIKNQDNELEIYGDRLPEFTSTYWANWFGQKDAKIFPYDDSIFRFTTKHGKKITINYSRDASKCEYSDVAINMNYDNVCNKGKIVLNKYLLDEIGSVLVYCDNLKCELHYDYNTRFVFR